MIPVCFPQDMVIGGIDTPEAHLRAFPPACNGTVPELDPARVYLLLEETMQDIAGECFRAGLSAPVKLPLDIFNSLSRVPLAVPELLYIPALKRESIRICLINGAGGGLGDAIMASPALEILVKRLAEKGVQSVQLDVYSCLPKRTAAPLQGIRSIQVRALPVSLEEFIGYDAYLDLSGMLHNPAFQTMHMTDFMLQQMGIDPQSVDEREKEPLLRIKNEPPGKVQTALALARAEAKGRPLVSVIFSATRMRAMPEWKAAEIIRALARNYLPVLVTPPQFDSRRFLEKHALHDLAVDLSAASAGFEEYIHLLSGMDAIVTVDTAAVHIGGALRIPTVGIFNSINKDYRITYSPSVRGIQLSYKGRHCQAPCGFSKTKAFIKSELGNGRTLHWEFGYACEESVDKQRVFAEVGSKLRAVDLGGDIDGQLAAIREEAKKEFSRHAAPCWESLTADAVLSALSEAIAKQSRYGDRQCCPVCHTEKRHRRLDRVLGRIRYKCRSCHADFQLPTDVEAEPDNVIARLPVPAPEEVRYVQEIMEFMRDDAAILLVETGMPDWDKHWTVGGHRNVKRLSYRNLRLDDTDKFDAVVALGVFDLLASPDTMMEKLAKYVGEDCVWLILTCNRQAFAKDAGQGGATGYRAGPGWGMLAHRKFLEMHNLSPIWQGATPLTWTSFQESLGPFPVLQISPPASGVTIRLTGEDLAAPLKSYLAPAFDRVSGQGRFFISLAGGKRAET